MTFRTILINFVRFCLFIFLQVLIFNNINLGGYINPYFYIYFILLLPFATPEWLLLIVSFTIGMCIDLFTNTPGLNAAACTVMGFARPFVIKWISYGTESLIGNRPSLRRQGVTWFLYYVVSLTLVHHFMLFYLEVFRLREFGETFVRVILSNMFTLVLILISEYLFFSREK